MKKRIWTQINADLQDLKIKDRMFKIVSFLYLRKSAKICVLIIAFAVILSIPLYSAVYYKVRKGDNLSKIAKKYKTSVARIKSFNNLKNDKIIIGRKLLVSKGKFVKKHYRVSKGDCLSKISHRYHISIKQIKSLNNLKNNRIIVGQKLLLLVKKKPVKKKLMRVNSIIEKKSHYYTVKKGDTLNSLSKKFNISEEEIKKANLLADGYLKPGQILVIPEPEDFFGKLFREKPADDILTKTQARVVNIAVQYLNIPYRWGGTNRNGLDCSGLIMEIYQKVGIVLPHKARYQYYKGEKVPLDKIMPSDAIFFAKYPSSHRVDHVGLYLGDGLFIHACQKEEKVVINNLNTNLYFQKRLVGVRRYLHF